MLRGRHGEDMKCANCGRDNPTTAAYCGNCGADLESPAQATPASSPPTSITPPVPARGGAETATRKPISLFSGGVGLFLLGLIVARPLYAVRWYPSDASFQLVSMGVGLAAALWLSLRVRLSGRLPGAVGMVLLTISVMGTTLSPLYGGPARGTVFPAVIGFALGLVLPIGFWRQLQQISRFGKGALATAALAGAILGWWLSPFMVFFIVDVLVAVTALLVGLPSVLIAPVVSTMTTEQQSLDRQSKARRWKRWLGLYFIIGGTLGALQQLQQILVRGVPLTVAGFAGLAAIAALVVWGAYWVIKNPKKPLWP